MNTKDLTRERISACADGELADAEFDAALAALRGDEAREDWALYHRIGDVLRSDEMDMPMSSSFAARMAARLDAEPIHLAPARANASTKLRRPLWQSLSAAAAVATFAFVATPPLMQALQGEPAPAVTAVAVPAAEELVVANGPDGVILRDPRIDDYLLAHQRYSPLVHGSAQFARSATFSGSK